MTALQDLAAREDKTQLKTYKRFPIALKRGRGSWVETTDGARYLDLYGGHAVVALGHNHPKLVAALKAQMDELLFYSNLVHLEVRARASEALTRVAPPGLGRAFFVNSGAEANEAALKLARRVTGRTEVLAFDGGFHGRTLAAVNVTGIDKYRGAGSLAVDGHHFAPFGDLAAAADRLASGAVAAVILEPVQSMAGGRVAAPEFYQGLRALCDRTGTLLVYDEIQTGIGRTGSWFFAPRWGVTPDLMTLGKALAGGVPMGAVLAKDAIADTVALGELGTTFGGGPLAAAGLAATLAVIEEEDVLAHVRAESAYLREALAAMPLVEAVQGVGFLLGVKLRAPAAQVTQALFARGILAGLSEDPSVMRLLPPLTLARAEVELFLAALTGVQEELLA